ncbi:hypothetical protein L596_008823 [Steinernema carpocapsae]|uniref:Uncharacterized protein n=1 Tax=Steinernema carpocapsae TaxID=34508 RepID=A0A4U5PDX4_STECR|nr:hypothetical protein L596_008823 [Steinernema carpocapsae]
MISKRIYSPQTVTLTATVAVVAGEKPLIGFSDDVEKKWRTLKKKHKIREKRKGAEKPAKLARVSSAGDLLDGANAALGQEGPRRSSTVSSVQNLMSKFKEIEATSRSESQYDVYSASYIPKRYSKMSPEYGRPKPGSLTEKRAQKAYFASKTGVILLSQQGFIETHTRWFLAAREASDRATEGARALEGLLLFGNGLLRLWLLGFRVPLARLFLEEEELLGDLRKLHFSRCGQLVGTNRWSFWSQMG